MPWNETVIHPQKEIIEWSQLVVYLPYSTAHWKDQVKPAWTYYFYSRISLWAVQVELHCISKVLKSWNCWNAEILSVSLLLKNPKYDFCLPYVQKPNKTLYPTGDLRGPQTPGPWFMHMLHANSHALFSLFFKICILIPESVEPRIHASPLRACCLYPEDFTQKYSFPWPLSPSDFVPHQKAQV